MIVFDEKTRIYFNKKVMSIVRNCFQLLSVRQSHPRLKYSEKDLNTSRLDKESRTAHWITLSYTTLKEGHYDIFFRLINAKNKEDFDQREKIHKRVPRVRIELTTFRFLNQIMRLTRCLLR